MDDMKYLYPPGVSQEAETEIKSVLKSDVCM